MLKGFPPAVPLSSLRDESLPAQDQSSGELPLGKTSRQAGSISFAGALLTSALADLLFQMKEIEVKPLASASRHVATVLRPS